MGMSRVMRGQMESFEIKRRNRFRCGALSMPAKVNPFPDPLGGWRRQLSTERSQSSLLALQQSLAQRVGRRTRSLPVCARLQAECCLPLLPSCLLLLLCSRSSSSSRGSLSRPFLMCSCSNRVPRMPTVSTTAATAQLQLPHRRALNAMGVFCCSSASSK